jgi:hypothetical protein
VADEWDGWVNWKVYYEYDCGPPFGMTQFDIMVMGRDAKHAMSEVERLLRLPAGSAKSAERDDVTHA